jgi:hypothetical protein
MWTHKKYIGVLTPSTWKVKLFGNTVFTGDQVKMNSQERV